MARNMYGATSADFTITSGGRVVPGAVLTVWTARTGGTQITDLLDVDSVACTTVTSDAAGAVVYYGPNNDKTVHWADSGQGSRVAIRPTDITGDPPVMSIGTVGTGTAAASLTGTSEAPVLNLTLPSSGANGVNTAAIQNDAVTADKIADNAVDTAAIADSAVTSAKILDGTITSTDVATSTFAAFGTVGNLLTANQASGTDTLGDTTGFSSAGASVASDTGWAAQGSRSVKTTITSASYPAAVVGSPYPAVTAGETVTFYAEANTGTLSGGTLSNLRMFVDFLNSGLSQVGSTMIVAASNGVFRHTTTVPATAVWARLRMGINSGSANVGEYFYTDKFGVWKGAGGTWAMPGVPIVGGSPIAANGAVHLSGTGVPESVITAAPGSTWLQIGDAVTVSGNLMWRKATGTGNTGWTPEGALADTGWRDITAALEAAFTTADPSTRVYLRRVGSLVEWTLANTGTFTPGTSSGTVNMWTIPSGFRSNIGSVPGGSIYHEPAARVRDQNGVLTGELWSPYNGSHTLYGFLFIAGKQRRARLSHFTDNSWPSSLPGSAA